MEVFFCQILSGPVSLQTLVSGSSASGVADAFGIPSRCWPSQAWLLPLQVSGSAGLVIPSQGLARHWVCRWSFFTWRYGGKQQISVGKISQSLREVTSPASLFQGAQATAILLAVCTESNRPLVCFSVYFPLDFSLTCLF